MWQSRAADSPRPKQDGGEAGVTKVCSRREGAANLRGVANVECGARRQGAPVADLTSPAGPSRMRAAVRTTRVQQRIAPAFCNLQRY